MSVEIKWTRKMSCLASAFSALLLCACASALAAPPALAHTRYGFPSGKAVLRSPAVTAARPVRPSPLSSSSCLQVLYEKKFGTSTRTEMDPSFDVMKPIATVATPETTLVHPIDLAVLAGLTTHPQPPGDPHGPFVLQNWSMGCTTSSTSLDLYNTLAMMATLNSTLTSRSGISVADNTERNQWQMHCAAMCDACDVGDVGTLVAL